MPASALRRRTLEAAPRVPPRRRRFAVVAILVALTLIALIVAFLPASLILRFLPPDVRVADTSGTIWHGAAGDILVGGRRSGAVEWTVRPWPLLSGRLDMSLRWALGAILAQGEANLDGKQLRLAGVQAGGPLADLAPLGGGANWNGQLEVTIDEFDAGYAREPWRITAITSARGALRVRNLMAKQSGARLGDYELEFPPGAATGDTLNGTLRDLGGPLETRGTLRIEFARQRLLVHGHARERPGAPPELVNELKQAAQLSGRDSAGRIPFDIEVSF